MSMPEWTHTVTIRWKVAAADRDAAWDIAEQILTTALSDIPVDEVMAIHDDTEVKAL